MVKHFALGASVAATALIATPALARPMTATDMHMMRRLTAPSVSPDGRRVVFALSTTDMAANKRNNELTLLDLTQPSAPMMSWQGAEGGHDAVYGSDGAIYFLKPVDGRDQLFRFDGAMVQISDFGADISGFKLAPSGDRLVVWADRDLRCKDLACKDLPKKAETGSGRTYDQLFVRHWDTWAEPGVRSRIFAFPIANGKVSGPGVPVTGALVGDTPSKPYGGGEEIDISADGKTVYFALREAGRIEATSTNLDIFAAPADGSAQPKNLTPDNDGTDNLPTLSPDSRSLAYFSMARAGYEADRQILQVRDLATGQVRAVTANWDRSVGSIAWSKDSKSILVVAEDVMEAPVFRIDVASGKVTKLTGEGHAGSVIPLASGGAIFTNNSVMAPDDLFRVDA